MVCSNSSSPPMLIIINIFISDSRQRHPFHWATTSTSFNAMAEDRQYSSICIGIAYHGKRSKTLISISEHSLTSKSVAYIACYLVTLHCTKSPKHKRGGGGARAARRFRIRRPPRDAGGNAAWGITLPTTADSAEYRGPPLPPTPPRPLSIPRARRF